MESMSHDPAAGAIGLHVVDIATRGLASGAAASAPVTALVPAGADEVSALAAAAFAAEGAAMLTLNTAAQEEVARTGVALTDIARMYSQVDGEAAGTLDSAGARIASQSFVGPTGGGLMRAETPLAAAAPPLAKPVEGIPVTNPSPTVPVPSPSAGGPAGAMPGAVNAASTLLGAGAAPLSSLGSVAQGASAGAAGPGLASSLTEQKDYDERHDAGERVV
ncbi:PE domain-containing protein [Mycobacterium sp. SMC-2]|uniref:PE domain-containing protein n=1 Tax=Mycobacterium sp. SMC-2 TaxID=2857058 RepID=UPI002203D0A0|nr:PE domain-containing protein [Mycobacterium sp. SMC-2]UXA04748.1 PE domain-containing protein [Mycobacterium sp. SMC-2]